MNKILPIRGKIQNYQWGGLSFLANFLGTHNTDQQPQAEYWLGVHPSAPAEISATGGNLEDYLNAHNIQLNFLLKVLDVQHMLSIQVHPNRQQAQVGFERENAHGIPISAKIRNYKDANHKPELMVALSEFWLLHGFMPKTKIIAALDRHNFLHPIRDYLAHHGIRNTFACILDCEQSITQKATSELTNYLEKSTTIDDKAHIDHWVQHWHKNNPNVNQGILALYFLNLVKLNPGEAIYQPAGLLHAYLEGQNIELMANSDNVLRAGLTPKHIDVTELLDVANFEPSRPKDYEATPTASIEGDIEFTTPFSEFALTQLQAQNFSTFSWKAQEAEIVLCTEGNGTIACKTQSFPFQQGEAFIVTPGTNTELRFNGVNGNIVRAKNLHASSAV